MTRVLIIDDDAPIRDVLKQILEREGFTVQGAGDGAEGLKLLQQSGYELVITDILMPNKEGLETISEIRRANPGIKIIAISGGGKSGTVEFLGVARLLGAQRTLHKPITRQELLQAVRELLAEV